MNYLLKIGGSLVNHPEAFKKLISSLSELNVTGTFAIITGGGILADKVRDLYKIYAISEDNAHWMAIKAQDILALLINSMLENSILVDDLSKFKEIPKNLIPIIEPYKILKESDKLPHSWSVTGDAIAVYIGKKLEIKNIILVKDVDGIFEDFNDPSNPKKLIKSINISELGTLKSTCIDSYTKKLLKDSNINLFLVNGFYPERILKILSNKEPVCTKILTY